MTSPAQPSKKPLKLLFVKLKHIGDALILTPTLVAARKQYPNAEIWAIVRKGTEGILAGCTAIDHLLTVAPIENDQRGIGNLWQDLRTFQQLRRQQFDYAFELSGGARGRWLAGLSNAQHRCAYANNRRLNAWWRYHFNHTPISDSQYQHSVEKDFNLVAHCLSLGEEIPALNFERSIAETPNFLEKLSDFVVIHPGTRWVKKRWLKEYWLDLGERLLQHTRHIVISSGPDQNERAFASELVKAWGGERATSTDGQLAWAGLAGILYRARAFVGVDTAAMHLSAACQCPTVAIFAYSILDHWRPWRVPHEVLHLGDQLPPRGKGQRPATEVMEKLKPQQVMAAVERQIRP